MVFGDNWNDTKGEVVQERTHVFFYGSMHISRLRAAETVMRGYVGVATVEDATGKPVFIRLQQENVLFFMPRNACRRIAVAKM